jgi:hypothetical protein
MIGRESRKYHASGRKMVRARMKRSIGAGMMGDLSLVKEEK